MVRFIKQEAEEKSNEIKVSAEEASRGRGTLVDDATRRLRALRDPSAHARTCMCMHGRSQGRMHTLPYAYVHACWDTVRRQHAHAQHPWPSDHHSHHHDVLCGTQEFNLEKLQLLEQEKARIRKEYERKENQIETKKKM